MGNKKTTTVFQQAVESTPDINNGFRNGLQALGSNAQRITAQDTRKLEGSVDIDACTQSLYPNEARWDYAVGYDKKAYSFEIHPADTSNVKEMIKKAEWLNKWLIQKAPALNSLVVNKVFYWIASGRQKILPNSPQSRQLSRSKIKLISNCKLPL